MIRRWAWVVPLLLLTGCGRALVRTPQVTLEGVRLGGLGLRGGTLLVALRVDNPNPFGLQAQRLDYDIVVRQPGGADADSAWVPFARGTVERTYDLPAAQSVRFEVPVAFDYEGLGEAAAAIFRAGSVSFRAQGTVAVRTPLGTLPVPFRKDGVATLTGLR